MKWSDQQEDALKKVAEWLASGDQQIFRLFGYAGCGKTTLAKEFGDNVDGRVLYGAPTGKAAYVLRQKDCSNASTVHSMIYHTKDKGRAALKEMEQQLAELRMELRLELSSELAPDDPAVPSLMQDQIEEHRGVLRLKTLINDERAALSRPLFTLNRESAVADAALVVIDEWSMVDGRLGEDLCSFGTKILALGDPAQLPPVADGGYFTDSAPPDVMLTEIHRQALGSPIIAMATRVRNEEPLELGTYGESLVLDQGKIDPTFAQRADQILVGRNKTRHSSNRRMRSLLGHTEPLPVPEDRLVCLRNNHEVGLLNGAIWEATDVGQLGDERMCLTIRPEDGGEELMVEAHTHHFLGLEGSLAWYERKDAEEFDYGYALTVHKAQGSQWDDVLLFDESWCFRKDRWRWLYTGITRAAKRIVVVRM